MYVYRKRNRHKKRYQISQHLDPPKLYKWVGVPEPEKNFVMQKLSKEEFAEIKERYPDIAQELIELSYAISAKTLQNKGQENFIE